MACTNSPTESETKNFRLIRAARDGDIERVRFWVENGADELNDAMAMAAYFGHSKIVSLLMNDFGVSADIALLAVAGATADDVFIVAQHLTGHVDVESIGFVTAKYADVARACVKRTTVLNYALRLAIESHNGAVYEALQ